MMSDHMGFGHHAYHNRIRDGLWDAEYRYKSGELLMPIHRRYTRYDDVDLVTVRCPECAKELY